MRKKAETLDDLTDLWMNPESVNEKEPPSNSIAIRIA